MRLHRLIAILLLIESRGSIKTRELAEALETSERTIHRDIAVLCESGIPIAATTGPHGGIRFMEGYSANINNLHCDDMISLFLCGIGVRPDEHSESSLKLKTALLKLENSMPSQYVPDIKMAKERFYFDPTPWWKEAVPAVYLDLLRKSVWQNKKIEIGYRKINGELSHRTVHPLGLVVKMMAWYLVGYCEKSHNINIFKCERITEAALTDHTFDYPGDFQLEAFWHARSSDFKAACHEKEYYPVDIRLHQKEADLLNDEELIQREDEGEHILATVNLHSYDFAQLEVLRLVGRCEVLRPLELRNHVRKVLTGLIRAYD